MRRVICVTRTPSPDLPPLRVEAHEPAPGDRGILAIGTEVGDPRAFPFPDGVVLPLEWLRTLREMLEEIDEVLRNASVVSAEELGDDLPPLLEGDDDPAWAEL